ncbi:MAG: DNA polymerase III subunit delta' [Spirochaetia bacterium]|nr:DNA polymerase III subunit delta' [Spirochaetia bacterium]
MFEYLGVFQPELAQHITHQLRSQTFSQVNLFGGPRYSLRLSFALEAARVLSCNFGAKDDCVCESCRRFDNLSVSNVVLISVRDHISCIEASLGAFERLYNDFTKKNLVRMIRRLLLQYHPALLDGTQTQNATNAATAAGALNELLLDISLQKEWDAKQAKKSCSELSKALKTLYAALKKNSTITIGQVRAVEQWIHQTSVQNTKRIVILEAIEQTNTSARNSLLKMLEEPPVDTYFFLLSEEPSRIMQTILSRVRRYTFPPLTEKAVARYLEPFYLKDRTYPDLETFYLEQGGMDLVKNQEMAEMVCNSMFQKQYLQSSQLFTILQNVEDMQSYEYFLKQVLVIVGNALHQNRLSCKQAQAYAMLINNSYSESLMFNQNGKLMLESLYYRMMEEA